MAANWELVEALKHGPEALRSMLGTDVLAAQLAEVGEKLDRVLALLEGQAAKPPRRAGRAPSAETQEPDPE